MKYLFLKIKWKFFPLLLIIIGTTVCLINLSYLRYIHQRLTPQKDFRAPKYTNESQLYEFKQEYRLKINESILKNHKSSIDSLIKYYEKKYDLITDNYLRKKWPPIQMNISNLKEMICELKSLPSTSFDQEDATRYKFKNYQLYPKHSFLHGKKFKSCAVVANSGGLLLSLGQEIDSHDAVVRLNEANTEGYEKHVGNKTTLRLVNSMVIHSFNVNLHKHSPFNKREIRLWFDVPLYNESPEEWHSKIHLPKFFQTYFEIKRNDNRNEDFILHTDVLWGQYKALQKFADIQLLYRPASSGFLATTLMMHYCDTIDLYGFIRTINWTHQCYYWRDLNNTDCDFKSSHPLPTEKKIYLRLNLLNDYEIFVKGKMRVLGFESWKC